MDKNDREFAFEYDLRRERFQNISDLNKFPSTEKEKKSILNLMNYFTEDKSYHKLANPKLTYFFLIILLLIKVILISSLIGIDFKVYEIQDGEWTDQVNQNDNNDLNQEIAPLNG